MVVSKLSLLGKDRYGVKLKFPNRKCTDCVKYPCFSGFDKCVSNFAAYGCFYYLERDIVKK